MANRTGQSPAYQDINRALPVTGPAPQVSFGQTSPDPGAFAQSFRDMAERIRRPADIVQSKLDRRAASEAQAQGASEAMSVDVSLRRDGTIRGENYDAAALRTMSARHENQVRAEANRIYTENMDNPAALEKKMQTYKAGMLQSNLPPEVKTELELGFDRVAQSYISDARARSREKILREENAAAQATIKSKKSDMRKMAFIARDDVDGEALLTGEIKGYQEFLLKYGPREEFTFDGMAYPADPGRKGLYTLGQIERELADTEAMVKETRVIGKFRQKSTLQEKQEFLTAFDEEFRANENDFNLDQYDRLTSEMRADIKAQQSTQAGMAKYVEKNLANARAMIEKGYDPGENVLNGLETDAMLSGQPETIARVAETRSLLSFQKETRLSRPDEIQSWINQEQARLQSETTLADGEEGPVRPVTSFEIARIEMAEKIKKEMTTELARDPLSFGNRVGLVQLTPLNIQDQASLEKRRNDAEIISTHYGTPMQVMTDEEVAQWKTGWDQSTPDQRVAMISAIQTGFGNDAVYAFGNLSRVSSGLANIGGLMSSNPAAFQSVARDYVIGETILQGGTKIVLSTKNMQESRDSAFGNAYAHSPTAMQAVEETAQKLYAAKAARRGKTADKMDLDSFDSALYEDALQEAAGAWVDQNGTRHGGVTEQKDGHYIVLPPNTSEDQWDTMIAGISDQDLIVASIGEMSPRVASGKIVKADILRDKYLVSTGPGRYLVSMTNPAKGAPNYLIGGNPDGFYEIDLTKLPGPRR